MQQKSDREFFANLLAVTMLTVLPLAVENGYFNIIQAKAHMLTLLCLMGWCCMLYFCLKTRGICFFEGKLTLLDRSVLLFGFVAVLSCCFSSEKWNTFTGAYGWCVGGGILVSLAMLYWFFSRSISIKPICLTAVIAVACGICLLAVLDAARVDVLGLHRDMIRNYYGYKSTLGNLNAHSGYLSLVLPFTAILFLQARRRKEQWLLYLAATLLLADVVVSATDGCYLGIGLCAFWAIPYLCTDGEKIKRFCLLVGTFGLLIFFHSSLECFSRNFSKLSGISAAIHRPVGYGILIAAGFTGYALLHFFPKLFQGERSRRWLSGIGISILLIAVLVLLIDAVIRFSDSWGNYRGGIWRVTIEAFCALPWQQKLFGIGPELQQTVLTELNTSRPIIVSHSEPLQILLTMGICGAACWCAVWGAVLKGAIIEKIHLTDRAVFFLPLVAYLGQSLVNSAYATNAGMLCVAFALYRRYFLCDNEVMELTKG